MTTMICFENLPTILHLHLQFLWMCNTNGSKNWGFSDRTEVQSLTASLTAKCVKYFDLASVCLKSFFFWGGGHKISGTTLQGPVPWASKAAFNAQSIKISFVCLYSAKMKSLTLYRYILCRVAEVFTTVQWKYPSSVCDSRLVTGQTHKPPKQ